MIVAEYQSKDWGPCVIKAIGQYQDKTQAVRVDGKNFPIGVLTVCVEQPVGFGLGMDEYIVKTWSENELFVPEILELGIFHDTGRRITTGYVEAQVWQLNRDSAHLNPLL